MEAPETFSYTIGWFYLLKIGNEIPLFLSIVIGICLVSVFAEEHTRKTDQVILCTYHGRKLVYHAKMFTGIIFGMFLTITSFVITFFTVYILFGLDSADAPAQFIFASISVNMTCSQMVLIYYGCLLIMELFYCLAIMVISEITGSNTISLAILFAYTMIGLFLNIPEKFRIASQIWGYSPNKVSSIYNVFDCRMIPIAGISFASWQIIPVVYALLILVIYFTGRSVYRNYQVKGR